MLLELVILDTVESEVKLVSSNSSLETISFILPSSKRLWAESSFNFLLYITKIVKNTTIEITKTLAKTYTIFFNFCSS